MSLGANFPPVTTLGYRRGHPATLSSSEVRHGRCHHQRWVGISVRLSAYYLRLCVSSRLSGVIFLCDRLNGLSTFRLRCSLVHLRSPIKIMHCSGPHTIPGSFNIISLPS